MELDEQIDVVATWIDDAERITVLTGAGISTDSGIPDFRGPNGVWTKNPAAEKMATIQHYLADPDVRRQAWRTRAANPAFAAEPNAGHLAVVELDRRGKLHAVVTQNVDGLHQRAGLSDELVVEVHGTMWWTRCWDCQDRRPMAETLARVHAGEEDPPCEVCGGILKSDTISFGQALVPEVIDRAMAVSEECRPAAGRRLDAGGLPRRLLRPAGEVGRGPGRDRQRRPDRDGPRRRRGPPRPDRDDPAAFGGPRSLTLARPCLAAPGHSRREMRPGRVVGAVQTRIPTGDRLFAWPASGTC